MLTRQLGSTLVSQGSADAGFHLILECSAQVSVNDAPRAQIGPGDYFGEMSLIDSAPPQRPDSRGDAGLGLVVGRALQG